MESEPAIGEALGECGSQRDGEGAVIATGFGGEQWGGDVATGGEVDLDRLAGLPVGGDLQDGGAA